MSTKKFKYIYKNVYNTFDACNKKIDLTFYKSQEYKKNNLKSLIKLSIV